MSLAIKNLKQVKPLGPSRRSRPIRSGGSIATFLSVQEKYFNKASTDSQKIKNINLSVDSQVLKSTAILPLHRVIRMASQFNLCSHASPRATISSLRRCKYKHKQATLVQYTVDQLDCWTSTVQSKGGARRCSVVVRVSSEDSYLDMWQKAVDRERKSIEFQKIAENSARGGDNEGGGTMESTESLEEKSSQFQKILEVPPEERDRIQRMQVIDRAAAAISAARALLQEKKQTPEKADSDDQVDLETGSQTYQDSLNNRVQTGDSTPSQNGSLSISEPRNTEKLTPGPDFWSWTPPETDEIGNNLNPVRKTALIPMNSIPVIEKERSFDSILIPLESKLFDSTENQPPLPPLQSLVEIQRTEQEQEIGVLFSEHAAEASQALSMTEMEVLLPEGVYEDGSRWWKETGIEERTDGVVCRWTLKRGVSADRTVEWEEKYWEAADDMGYKELGSEKSGRNASGNVWREFWKESMSQKDGVVSLEKTADKWGKNGKGDEWQEKWWEHYGEAGKAEKWAHKWCSIDPNTPLDAGHAHVWHERWGETYDGKGGSVKYTDKWAERSEFGGWSKWGDKWDEHFDENSHGIKQGETWWQGQNGERWNRTWGEGHNGSGWVHKYGQSSSGEHWDTHEEQETWYERFPHYGFYHCFENSVQLRAVKKRSALDSKHSDLDSKPSDSDSVSVSE